MFEKKNVIKDSKIEKSEIEMMDILLNLKKVLNSLINLATSRRNRRINN